MLTRFALAALTLAAVATPVAAQTWKIDTAHSTARFTVRHMMVSNVHGSFGKVEGTVVFDGSNVAGIKADAIELWTRLGVLPADVTPEYRAEQLVAAAYCGGQLAVRAAELLQHHAGQLGIGLRDPDGILQPLVVHEHLRDP